ncbi:MAG: hypothetical protein PHW83_02910 [Bacteroidales bacterium]|nr:hypothetical protein [Bacteroidales bacterium]
MKKHIVLYIIFLLPLLSFSQSFNSKAIQITNNLNANYVEVTGTKIKIIPPKGFVKSTSYMGFSHQIAGSSILITEIPGDVNKNFIGFDKKFLFKSGVIVEEETFYQINGYDALLIKGKQAAYGKTYIRLMLVIGDIYRSYLLSASMLSTSSEKHVEEVKVSLLGVIYDPNKKSDITDRFDFTVDVSGTILKKANLMLSSLTYTDDGNVPSNTTEKTSMTIRKSTMSKSVSEDEKKVLCQQLFEMYPLEWVADIKQEQKPITIANLSGYEIYSMGKNKDLYKMELIYQVVLFNNLDYYVITGITYGKFEENLTLFKKIAKTFKPYK